MARFIAVILVAFGLTANETLDEIIDLSLNILDKPGLNAETRTLALRDHINSLMIKYRIDRECRLLDPNTNSQGCKLYAVYPL